MDGEVNADSSIRVFDEEQQNIIVGIFVVIFVIVWIAQYLSWKRKIKRMNDCFKKGKDKK